MLTLLIGLLLRLGCEWKLYFAVKCDWVGQALYGASAAIWRFNSEEGSRGGLVAQKLFLVSGTWGVRDLGAKSNPLLVSCRGNWRFTASHQVPVGPGLVTLTLPA